MVKIYTEDFKKNSKLFLGICEKGNQLNESIYFDFTNGNVYIKNQKIQLRMPFIWEKVDEIIPENFFVSIEKFLPICQMYNELFINDTIFSNNEETFEIPTFKDEIDLSIFETQTEFVELNSDILNDIKYGILYSDQDEISNLSGIFIQKNKIVSTNKKHFYNKEIEKDLPNFNLPNFLVKIFNIFDAGKIVVSQNENLIFIKFENNIEIICSKVKNLELPIDINSKEFLSIYNHETFFTIEKNSLLENLKFLDIYVKEAPNQRIYITFLEKMININVKDFCKIKKECKIIQASESLLNNTFSISLNDLKSSLVNSEFNIIKIQIEIGKAALNVTSSNSNGDISKRNIIITTLRE